MPATPVYLSDQEMVLEQAINKAMENWLADNNTRIDDRMSAMNSRLDQTINAVKTLNDQYDNIKAMLEWALNVPTSSTPSLTMTSMPGHHQEEPILVQPEDNGPTTMPHQPTPNVAPSAYQGHRGQ
jgi:hypothetical protein